MADPVLVPHDDRFDPGMPPEEAARRFFEVMRKRRSVRSFSDRPVSRETVEWVVRAATTAPSGANKQPWRFVAVGDPETKRRIRLAAEEEERRLYGGRASEEWLADLETLGTGPDKPYLEVAPWLVVVFRLTHDDDGGKVYYSQESVGLAVGLLLAAAHHAGLATLVHTPSPMGFLRELLGRPGHEKPWALIPLGWPSDDCTVPAEALTRRPLERTLVWHAPPSGEA